MSTPLANAPPPQVGGMNDTVVACPFWGDCLVGPEREIAAGRSSEAPNA